MPLLFDFLRIPEALTAPDLRTLAFFGVRAAALSVTATADAAQLAERELTRLRQADIAAFLCFAPSAGHLPGGALETELQRLPRLLSLPRAVALGPLALDVREPAATYVLQRVLELGRDLQRPVLVQSRAAADGKEVRRLLALIRESAIPPPCILGLGLPRAALLLFRECGHAVALTLSRGMTGPELVDTVSRFGSDRVLLASAGGDFLGVPKAVALLEEAGLPSSVQRRVAFENALRLLGIEDL